MSQKASRWLRRLSISFAQVILYLGAIDALSEAYRSAGTRQQDPFLFRTVYESLWDGVIVRVATIWDKTKNVGSLPQLSAELKRLRTAAASAVAKVIDKAESDERRRLREWRHLVVAHSSLSLDPESFDAKNGINASDVRSEVQHVEQLLQAVNNAIGRPSIHYEILKEDALANARSSLARWKQDVA